MMCLANPNPIAMSKQALESERVRRGLLEILLGPGQLYEALRAKVETGKKQAQT